MKNTVNKDSNTVGSVDWIRSQADMVFRSSVMPNVDYWMRDVLVGENAIIMERVEFMDDAVNTKLLRSEFTINDNEITFTEPEEVTIEYVAKARAAEKDNTTELTGPIVGKSDAKRIAWAAVLVPGEADSDGDVVDKEKIEEVAHSWLGSYGNVDLQHTLNNVATPVESYVTHEEREVSVKSKQVVLPAGTWILASRINDEDTWNKVVSGDLSGYSIMGVKKAALKSDSANKNQDVALKRTTLADLGTDWVAPFVSVVDEPAVPKAKFFALKQKQQEPTKDSSGFFGRLLKSKTSDKEDEMNEEQVKQMIEKSREADAEVIKGLQKQADTLLDEIKSIKETTKKGDADDKGDHADKDDPPNTEDKATEAETLKKRIDELEAKLETSSKADDNTDIETLKQQASELETKLDEANKSIEKMEAQRAPSRSIKGQDDPDTSNKKKSEPEFEDRDAYGRFRPSKK